MHTIGRMGLLIALLLGVAACGNAEEAGDPTVVQVTSKAALYQGTFTASPVVGHNELRLVLSTTDGTPLEGALVASDLWCPEHGHGSSDTPMCSERGHGSYLVSNVVFTMPGLWDVHVYVSSPAGDDELVASYDLD